MKKNDPHHWQVMLFGQTKPDTTLFKKAEFKGDIQGVLGFTDELEDEVKFEVVQFVITRAEKIITPRSRKTRRPPA